MPMATDLRPGVPQLVAKFAAKQRRFNPEPCWPELSLNFVPQAKVKLPCHKTMCILRN
jgi:hypothetical protein